jgi:hypothetical protein
MAATVILRAALLADPTVSDLIGARAYYSVAPQGAARPYCVIVHTGERDGRHLGGMSQYPEASLSVICIADSHQAVDQLGDAVVATLQDAKGVIAGREAVFARDAVDGSDYVPAEKVHRRIVGFKLRFR